MLLFYYIVLLWCCLLCLINWWSFYWWLLMILSWCLMMKIKMFYSIPLYLHTLTSSWLRGLKTKGNKRQYLNSYILLNPPLRGRSADSYLRPGWPVMSPDLPPWFWWAEGWRGERQLEGLPLTPAFPGFLRCSAVWRRASAGRLNHQTLQRDSRETTGITKLSSTSLNLGGGVIQLHAAGRSTLRGMELVHR